MDEKVIIKSTPYRAQKVFLWLAIILATVCLITCVAIYLDEYLYVYNTYLEHSEIGDCGYWWDSWETCYTCREYIDKSVIHSSLFRIIERGWYLVFPSAAFSLICLLIYFCTGKFEMTVTNNRIYGKDIWLKQVDLPVDSVSAISIIPLLKGVSVSTSSGKICFLAIKNVRDIHKEISNLLLKRQQEKQETLTTTIVQSDEADLLKKYKDLLDNNIITQEEFDAKKKQLLNL